MDSIIFLNYIISIIFTLCYFYQAVYVVVGLLGKERSFKAKHKHRYAVVISARNEQEVIGQLMDSIKAQTYPEELIDTFVIADNCTDCTAQKARDAGAIVYERFNTELVGKGYALDWLFKIIKEKHADAAYDAYIVFDADNVIEPDFIEEMNNMYDNGYRILTSYRNSKNYDENWISAGYSLWFLREAKFLNNARMQLDTSCAISGTGFLIGTEVIERNNGWIHHLLTEDIEFTTDSIIQGERIGYCGKAMLYDEQPVTFKQSYIQRLRWSKGFYQVFRKYGMKLFGGIITNKNKNAFSCYDMLMTIMPAMLLTLISMAIVIGAIPVGIFCGSSQWLILLETLGNTIWSFYLLFYMLGAITTITERKKIHCSNAKKFLYTFTFPLFMLTYVPISIIALFKKVRWEPIKHTVSKSVSEICEKQQ